MPRIVRCPACSAQLKIANESKLGSIKCPKCHTQFPLDGQTTVSNQASSKENLKQPAPKLEKTSTTKVEPIIATSRSSRRLLWIGLTSIVSVAAITLAVIYGPRFLSNRQDQTSLANKKPLEPAEVYRNL